MSSRWRKFLAHNKFCLWAIKWEIFPQYILSSRRRGEKNTQNFTRLNIFIYLWGRKMFINKFFFREWAKNTKRIFLLLCVAFCSTQTLSSPPPSFAYFFFLMQEAKWAVFIRLMTASNAPMCLSERRDDNNGMVKKPRIFSYSHFVLAASPRNYRVYREGKFVASRQAGRIVYNRTGAKSYQFKFNVSRFMCVCVCFLFIQLLYFHLHSSYKREKFFSL